MAPIHAPNAITYELEPRLEQYLFELGQLCAIECPTSSKAGVDQAGAWVRDWVEQHGWDVRDFPDATVGDGLLATLHGKNPQGPARAAGCAPRHRLPGRYCDCPTAAPGRRKKRLAPAAPTTKAAYFRACMRWRRSKLRACSRHSPKSACSAAATKKPICAPHSAF